MEQDREDPDRAEDGEEAGDKAGAGAEWVASARGRAAIVFAPSAENSRSIWLRNRALRENARVAEHP